MTTRSNRSDSGNRPKAGEVTGQKSFWFLLGRLPKETRPKRSAGGSERAVYAQRMKPLSITARTWGETPLTLFAERIQPSAFGYDREANKANRR
jgi:hypothetical protein